MDSPAASPSLSIILFPPILSISDFPADSLWRNLTSSSFHVFGANIEQRTKRIPTNPSTSALNVKTHGSEPRCQPIFVPVCNPISTTVVDPASSAVCSGVRRPPPHSLTMTTGLLLRCTRSSCSTSGSLDSLLRFGSTVR